MRRLLALATITVALFAGSAAVAEGKLPGFGTDDTCACGGQVYLIYTLVTWPPWAFPNAMCERHYSNGGVTYGPC